MNCLWPQSKEKKWHKYAKYHIFDNKSVRFMISKNVSGIYYTYLLLWSINKVYNNKIR